MNQLPLRTFSLQEFCRYAKDLAGPIEDQANFIDFVLSGKFTEGGTQHQAVIDSFRNVVPPALPLKSIRDFDSLIGIVREIPVTGPLMLFPVPNPKDTLTANNHLTYNLEVNEVQSSVPLSKIPNISLGMWNVRHSIHLFFPKLYSPARKSPHLTRDQKRTFYECGLRPTIDALLPLDKNDWPPSLDAEMFRALNSRGGLSLSSKTIPEWAVAQFPLELIHQLSTNDVDWHEDMFFLLTLRGLKGTTRHRTDKESATVALRKFFEHSSLPIDALGAGSWFIDVGLEITSPGPEDLCLQWRTDTHHMIVGEILNIEEHHATRITSVGSSKYSRDISSHLTGVSGCRIEPGARAEGPFEAMYLQLYATDKSLTYHPDGHHHAKAMGMKDAIGKRQPPAFINQLFGAYSDARFSNSSNARIEVRVPLQHALSTLLELDRGIVRNSLLAFTRQQWWSFRMYRLQAISKVFDLQVGGEPQLRSRPDALLLTAACVWLLNALHARPEDGPASRRLMDAVLPLTEKDQGDPDCFAYRVAWTSVLEGEAGDDWENQPEESDISDDEDDEEPQDNSDEDDSEPEESTRTQTQRRRHRLRQPTSEKQIDDHLAPYLPFGAIFLRQLKSDVDVPRMRAGGPFISPKAFYFWFRCNYEDIIDRFNPEEVIPQSQIPFSSITRNRSRQTSDLPRSHNTSRPILFNLSAKGVSLEPPAVDDGSDVENEPEEDSSTANIDQVTSDLYRLFLVDVLRKAPNIVGRSARSYLRLTEDQRTHAKEGVYATVNLPTLWRACQHKVEPKERWRRAFGHLFPPKGHSISAKRQNYHQCLYYKRWRRLCRSNSEESIEAIRTEFFKRIWKRFSWLPHAGSDRMWATTSLDRFGQWPEASDRSAAPRIILKQAVQYTWEAMEEVESV